MNVPSCHSWTSGARLFRMRALDSSGTIRAWIVSGAPDFHGRESLAFGDAPPTNVVVEDEYFVWTCSACGHEHQSLEAPSPDAPVYYRNGKKLRCPEIVVAKILDA